MTQIITTKDLTKNELSGAKILAVFVILAGLGIFLNSAQMEQKDLPEIVFSTMPTQAIDGSGLVSFSANIGKLSGYDARLNVSYSLDNESYLPALLSRADIDGGSLTLTGDGAFQISAIDLNGQAAKINFAWDAKPNVPNFSGEQVKIKITLFFRLKDKNFETENNDAGATIGSEEVNPGAQSDGNESEPSETPATPVDLDGSEVPVAEPDILPINPDDLNTLVAAMVAVVTDEDVEVETIENGESEWSELSVMSDIFRMDTQDPKIESGTFDVQSRKLQITFSEPMNTAFNPDITHIVLQNSAGDINYNLIKGTSVWLQPDSLTLDINLSNIDIAFLTLDEVFVPLLSDMKFLAEPGNNMKDLFGNEVFDASYISEKKDETAPEIKDEEKEQEEEQDADKDKEAEDDQVDEKKEEEIITPPNNKTINIRGYNQNCSFNPDELMMSAGTTAQAELILSPLDPESEYILTTSTLPNDFEVKILQPSGAGTGPINLEITAPANAVSRLYKLLIKYQDILPQSVSYVNNCVLRLNVQ